MYYKLVNKKSGESSKWFRIQRIHYWRISETYSKKYHVLTKDEPRSKGRQDQWLNFRTLGNIKRAEFLLNEILRHPLADELNPMCRTAMYKFLTGTRLNINRKSKPKKWTPPWQL